MLVKDPYARRVRRLIHILENVVPPDQFDMETWSHDCGTPACAAGHATADPVLRAEGLKAWRDIVTVMLPINANEPIYDGFYGYKAMQEFLTGHDREVYPGFNEDVEDIFRPSTWDWGECPTPAEVAAKIREVFKAPDGPVWEDGE